MTDCLTCGKRAYNENVDMPWEGGWRCHGCDLATGECICPPFKGYPVGNAKSTPAAGNPLHYSGAELGIAGPRVVSLADVQPERIEWLWDGYLPLGKVVVLDGDPGVGKSTVLLDIAARLSTGSPMPDGTPSKAGSVLVLSAEDGLSDTIRPRLDAARADAGRVITITEITYLTEGEEHSRPVSIPGDLPAIELVIAEHEVRLVIVDVLMAYLSADVNAHRDQDVRRALHVMSSLAERAGCCVIVLRHLNKSGGPNALYRGGGSIGIVGAARAAFMCGRDPADDSGQTRVLAPTKMNIAAEPPALAYRLVPDELHGCGRIEWLGASEHQAADLLAEPGSQDDRDQDTARDEAAGWLADYLTDQGGEATPGDAKKAAREAGIATRTLERARIKAGARISRSGFPARTVWQLATVSPQSRQARQLSGDGAAGETGGETAQPPALADPQSRQTRQPADRGETGRDKDLGYLARRDPSAPDPAPPCQHEECWDAMAGRCLHPEPETHLCPGCGKPCASPASNGMCASCARLA